MKPLHSAPAVGFEQPYEMLEACHERVLRSLDLLLRLAAHLQTQGTDSQARDAARDILRYFDIAAPHHHEDEERHVLPRLRASGEAAQVALAARVEAEHRQMGEHYQRIRPGLQALVDAGELPSTADWAGFAALYRAHIELEESLVFPRAAQALSAAELQHMGQEMRGRRQVARPA